MQPASLPAFGHRGTASAFSRHGGVSNSAAIPAGSSDLPEGMVIPEGWSLLPLQRLDGQPLQMAPNAPAAAGSSQQEANPLAHGQAIVPPPLDGTAAGLQDAVAEPSMAAAASGTPADVEPADAPASAPAQHQPRAAPEPPEMAAPTPLLPNWGGPTPSLPNWGSPAQSFANGGGMPSSATPAPAPEAAAAGSSSSAAAADPEPAPAGEEDACADERGKARAATVEDADDADDEQQPG